MRDTQRSRIGGFVSASGRNVAGGPRAIAGHASQWLRERLHALARRIAGRLAPRRSNRLPPAPMSAARSEKDTTAHRRGSLPGVPPAPSIDGSSFPAAAAWLPVLPPDLRTPPVRRTASGVFRVADNERRATERRFTERRIRDDGSPYGHERRHGGDVRTTDRRGPLADDSTPPAEASPVRPPTAPPTRARFDYVQLYPDLLARFHGR
jgi:hypothetical protein